MKELYQPSPHIQENSATPRQMLKILLYAYMNRIYSFHGMEYDRRRDVNFMYTFEEVPSPDHISFAVFFLNLFHCVTCQANAYEKCYKKAYYSYKI